MIYLLSIFIVISGFYTFTYGKYILKEEKNPLGGIATILLGILSPLISIIILFMKQQ